MQIKTKKKIAKEIIFFFIGLGIALLIYLFTYPYNWFFQVKIDSCESLMSDKYLKINTLDSIYLIKQKKHKWFFDKNHDAGWDYYKTPDSMWSRLEYLVSVDSLEYKYNNTWGKDTKDFLENLGFTTDQKFKSFIINYSFTKNDCDNHIKAITMGNDISKLQDETNDYRSKLLPLDYQIHLGLTVFILILILLYPIRFLYFLLRWCIRILKEKDNNTR